MWDSNASNILCVSNLICVSQESHTLLCFARYLMFYAPQIMQKADSSSSYADDAQSHCAEGLPPNTDMDASTNETKGAKSDRVDETENQSYMDGIWHEMEADLFSEESDGDAIVDDRRRSKLSRLLLDYGQRVQYSVFECDLTKKVLDTVLKGIIEYVSDDEDSVRVYRLCTECVALVQAFGPQRVAQTPAAVVV